MLQSLLAPHERNGDYHHNMVDGDTPNASTSCNNDTSTISTKRESSPDYQTTTAAADINAAQMLSSWSSSSSSKSSSSSHLAPSPPPVSHPVVESMASVDDLIDDGLLPQWPPWELCPSPECPQQSYVGYIDVCRASLPPNVLHSLAKCTEYPSPQHSDPWPTIRNTDPIKGSPYHIYRRHDIRHGRIQHKLIASRTIGDEQVIGFLGGQLQLTINAEREGIDALQVSHVKIDRGHLSKFYEYRGDQSLILSMKQYHNSLKYIRDPALFLSDDEEKRPDCSQYNCRLDIAYDTKSQLIFLIIFAWGEIPEGNELLCFLSLGQWYSRDHKRLFIKSRINHWYHRYVTQIEQTLKDHHIKYESLAEVKEKPKKTSDRSSSSVAATSSNSSGNITTAAIENNYHQQNHFIKTATDNTEESNHNHTSSTSSKTNKRKKSSPVACDSPDPDGSNNNHNNNNNVNSDSGNNNHVISIDSAIKDHSHLVRKGSLTSSAAHTLHLMLNADDVGPVLSTATEWKFLCDEEDRDEAERKHGGIIHIANHMEKLAIYEAFPMSKCSYIKKVFYGKTITTQTKQVWSRIPDFIPESIVIDNDIIPVNPQQIRELVTLGHNADLVDVRLVTSLLSPVRYFTAPWYPAFAVCARKNIKRGTFVFTYAGELEQDVQNKDSVYVYDAPADAVRQNIPMYPENMPDLLIDAQNYGGIARFVNDYRYRKEEGDEGTAANLSFIFVFIDHCIHLCCYVTRDIKVREELISSYGDEFWRVCTGQMLIDHQSYYNYITAYHQRLVGLAQKHQVCLPTEPSYLLESEPLFTRKPLRYAREATTIDVLPDTVADEWEVESILAKGRMGNKPHYLVHWKGFDSSFDSWEPCDGMSGCTELIKAFERDLWKENQLYKKQQKKTNVGNSNGHHDNNHNHTNKQKHSPHKNNHHTDKKKAEKKEADRRDNNQHQNGIIIDNHGNKIKKKQQHKIKMREETQHHHQMTNGRSTDEDTTDTEDEDDDEDDDADNDLRTFNERPNGNKHYNEEITVVDDDGVEGHNLEDIRNLSSSSSSTSPALQPSVKKQKISSNQITDGLTHNTPSNTNSNTNTNGSNLTTTDSNKNNQAMQSRLSDSSTVMDLVHDMDGDDDEF